jgi:tetratricopeptide (TPR) repeat protein
MTTQEVKCKLTAILSADVKGYSRLMGEDEVETIRTLNIYKELMTKLIQQHHRRVVDAPGDNVLAEFGSVVDAVKCAVEIQKELKTRNGELPENRRMEFRTLGHAYFLVGEYEQAIDALRRVLDRNPSFHPAHIYLALCLGQLGRVDEAQAEAAEFTMVTPNMSWDSWKQRLPYKDKTVLDGLFETLLKAMVKPW